MADPTMRDLFLAIRKIRQETPQMAWMLDHPGPAKLLIQRASGQIDDQMFWFKMYKTPFWKRTSDSQRQWRAMVSIDPAKARRQRQTMTSRVQQLIGEMGITLPKNKKKVGGRVGHNSPARIADFALSNGWDEAQLTNYLLSFSTWGQEGQNPTGGTAVAMNQMRRLAEEYGVNPRDRRLFKWTKRVLNGRDTIEGVEERLRGIAQGRYGGNETITGVLDRGGTVADWFDPYKAMIAQELEIPDAEISMNDRRWQQVMNHNDGGSTRPMSFGEAQRFVRSQDEWGSTRGAQEQSAAMVSGLLEGFGKVAF